MEATRCLLDKVTVLPDGRVRVDDGMFSAIAENEVKARERIQFERECARGLRYARFGGTL